jgi:hypothetical protein
MYPVGARGADGGDTPPWSVVEEAAARKAARRSASTTQAEQDLYQRQIEATDREIDALVYELRPKRVGYGLTRKRRIPHDHQLGGSGVGCIFWLGGSVGLLGAYYI